MPINTYAVCLSNQSQIIPFDPFNYRQADYPGFIEIDYLAGAFQTLERDSDIEGITFYITWNVNNVPTYGNQIVVILMGDEWCRFPSYLGEVRAIFRAHSNWPVYTGNSTGGLSYNNLIALVQFIRLHLIGLPGRIKFLTKRHTHSSKNDYRTYTIPLGYANQLELPLLPFEKRTTDVSFMGSTANTLPPKTSLRHWIQSPKTVARTQMLNNVQHLQQNHPKLTVHIKSIEEFAGNLLGHGLSVEEEKIRYSGALMDTKICLVPRGSSLETFRLFEAMRYGCIAICDRLPSRWYYEGLPAIQIDHWDELEDVVKALINNPERMRHLHQSAQVYWQTACSEAILGRFIAKQLAKARQDFGGLSKLAMSSFTSIDRP